VHRKRQNIASLIFANFFFFLNFSELILLPKFIIHLKGTPADIGTIMGIFNLAVIVSLPLVGIASEKIAKKYLFIAGALGMSIATFMFTCIDSLGFTAYCLRILQGVSFSFAFGVSGAMVFDIEHGPDRNRFLGILTVANITTHAIGPGLGEYLIAHAGFCAYFMSACIFGFIAAIAGLFLPLSSHARSPLKANIKPISPFLFGSFIVGSVFGATVVFLPPYLMGIGITNSTPFFVSFVLGAILVWALFYKGIGLIGKRSAWVIAAAMFVFLPFMIHSIAGLMSLVLCSIIFGIGYGYAYPTLNAAAMEAVPSAQGMANAMFVWAFNLGMAVTVACFGVFSSAYGYALAFLLLGIIGLSLFVIRKT
jgi:MFS family permease